MRQNIIVLDFGGQYNQLIARRVRECNVYCEVHPYTLDIETLKQMAPSGIILTGGPNSVYGEDSPQCNPEVFKLGIPVLGICYGAQSANMGGRKLQSTIAAAFWKALEWALRRRPEAARPAIPSCG